MVSNIVSLKDIKPLVNAPSMALINALMNQTMTRLRLCRSEWWRIQGAVCLDNQPVVRVAAGKVRLGKALAPVGVIVARSGTFKANKVAVQVKWPDGVVSNETVTG